MRVWWMQRTSNWPNGFCKWMKSVSGGAGALCTNPLRRFHDKKKKNKMQIVRIQRCICRRLIKLWIEKWREITKYAADKDVASLSMIYVQLMRWWRRSQCQRQRHKFETKKKQKKNNIKEGNGVRQRIADDIADAAPTGAEKKCYFAVNKLWIYY